MRLRLCHLYPRELNIYADRGNLAVLGLRCAWRGIALETVEVGVGEFIAPGAFDLFYLGGGQDRDQLAIAQDLVATKAESLREAVAEGAALLAVCGGYQLAGHGYTGVSGAHMPGAEVLDVDTVAGDTRMIGNVVIEADLAGEHRTVVGFENHAGRTTLGPAARPLGQVVHGHGNNGSDGGEGAVQGRAIGTYLHGPLLPKNPWLADLVIRWALAHGGGGDPGALSPLDDRVEDAAHAVAVGRARGAATDRPLGRRRRAPR